MEGKENNKGHRRSLLIRVLLFAMAFTVLRFVYVMVEEGACDEGQSYCFLDLNPLGSGKKPSKMPRQAFKSHEVYIQMQLNKTVNPELQRLWTTKEWRQKVDEFSVFFQGFMEEGLLKSEDKALCVGAKEGQQVLALREIGVSDAVGIDTVPSLPLVMEGDFHNQPFEDFTFDFVYSDVFDSSAKFAEEISRILKPGGIAVLRMHEMYSIDSFILSFFSNFGIVRSAKWEGNAEIVLKKNVNTVEFVERGKCSVRGWKKTVMEQAEPLIETEPLKPWITLKTNLKNIKYLPTVTDIGSRRNYHYVDVGARSYGSSIGSWFKKRYPKQNKTFNVYAIEADESFYGDYQKRKGVKLLPYAAWVRNESLSFEINRDAGSTIEAKGMGRIQPSSTNDTKIAGNRSVKTVQGFDFAEWLKNTVSADDFVVMKMDVEGTEFDLVPRLMETGAICLIDELFLECHYNRWQKCCPERSPKYQRTYGECLDLFNSLRSNGVLVHQWW
ncbi:hypothetical protein SUGI_0783510 [Cryptomeria japonica]|uniref:uncharacterized protein LOC131028721 n=1 Tax=Cryptomeria japonica TaxID=3369 RepID=UPI00241486CE|nr:uncharacterized protein LOC131028721 [Cryptomeria japonica]GLJ38466.1 hypothetical protein SUGI_0783510 [Cryptomeria japonica]